MSGRSGITTTDLIIAGANLQQAEAMRNMSGAMHQQNSLISQQNAMIHKEQYKLEQIGNARRMLIDFEDKLNVAESQSLNYPEYVSMRLSKMSADIDQAIILFSEFADIERAKKVKESIENLNSAVVSKFTNSNYSLLQEMKTLPGKMIDIDSISYSKKKVKDLTPEHELYEAKKEFRRKLSAIPILLLLILAPLSYYMSIEDAAPPVQEMKIDYSTIGVINYCVNCTLNEQLGLFGQLFSNNSSLNGGQSAVDYLYATARGVEWIRHIESLINQSYTAEITNSDPIYSGIPLKNLEVGKVYITDIKIHVDGYYGSFQIFRIDNLSNNCNYESVHCLITSHKKEASFMTGFRDDSSYGTHINWLRDSYSQSYTIFKGLSDTRVGTVGETEPQYKFTSLVQHSAGSRINSFGDVLETWEWDNETSEVYNTVALYLLTKNDEKIGESKPESCYYSSFLPGCHDNETFQNIVTVYLTSNQVCTNIDFSYVQGMSRPADCDVGSFRDPVIICIGLIFVTYLFRRSSKKHILLSNEIFYLQNHIMASEFANQSEEELRDIWNQYRSVISNSKPPKPFQF
jgi:hypothetical protein